VSIDEAASRFDKDITKSLKILVNFLFLSETHAKHKMSIIDGFITYKDLTIPLFEHLSFVDRWSLIFACPRLFSDTPRHQRLLKFHFIIESKFAELGFPIHFCRLLADHHQVVSGSFLLALMFGTKDWNPGDIDIFGCIQAPDPFLECLMNIFGKKISSEEAKQYWKGKRKEIYRLERDWIVKKYAKLNSSSKLPRVVICPSNSEHMITYNDDDTFVEIFIAGPRKVNEYPNRIPVLTRRYIWRNNNVNHIQVCHGSAIHYVSKEFDFDFCKVIFDGKRLQVYNWQNIFQRSCLVNWSAYIKTFEIGDRSQNEIVQKLIGERLQVRISKYRSRGFDVKVVDEAIHP